MNRNLPPHQFGPQPGAPNVAPQQMRPEFRGFSEPTEVMAAIGGSALSGSMGAEQTNTSVPLDYKRVNPYRLNRIGFAPLDVDRPTQVFGKVIEDPVTGRKRNAWVQATIEVGTDGSHRVVETEVDSDLGDAMSRVQNANLREARAAQEKKLAATLQKPGAVAPAPPVAPGRQPMPLPVRPRQNAPLQSPLISGSVSEFTGDFGPTGSAAAPHAWKQPLSPMVRRKGGPSNTGAREEYPDDDESRQFANPFSLSKSPPVEKIPVSQEPAKEDTRPISSQKAEAEKQLTDKQPVDESTPEQSQPKSAPTEDRRSVQEGRPAGPAAAVEAQAVPSEEDYSGRNSALGDGAIGNSRVVPLGTVPELPEAQAPRPHRKVIHEDQPGGGGGPSFTTIQQYPPVY